MPNELCTKCGVNPRASLESNNPWCKECRAQYQKEWQAMMKERANGKGYAEGARAMRDHISGELSKLGGSMVMAYEVARFVRGMELPAAKS